MAASSCWNCWSRARSGPSAITPRSALWPSTAKSSAWWPSSTERLHRVDDALARLRVGLRARRGRPGRRGGGLPTRRAARPASMPTRVLPAVRRGCRPDRDARRSLEGRSTWSSGGAWTSTGTPNSVISIVSSAVPAPAPNAPTSMVRCIFTTRSWSSIHTSAGTVPSLASARGLGRRVGQLVDHLRVVDRRAVVRRRARPATVSSPTVSTSPDRPCRYSRPCLGEFDSAWSARSPNVPSRLLELLGVDLDPLLARERRRRAREAAEVHVDDAVDDALLDRPDDRHRRRDLRRSCRRPTSRRRGDRGDARPPTSSAHVHREPLDSAACDVARRRLQRLDRHRASCRRRRRTRRRRAPTRSRAPTSAPRRFMVRPSA